jgi:2Fe-2S ferredoxin
MPSSAARIRVLPSDIEFTVAEDQTVLEAAKANDIIWPTVCDGDARCGRCFMQTLEGDEHLSPMSAKEQQTLDLIRWHGEPRNDERLACCTEISGDVVVLKRGVRYRTIEMERNA